MIVAPGTTVRYTPWKMNLFCQRPQFGSKWYYGNFALGITIDGHPRFYNIIFCFLFCEFGIGFKREAVLVPPIDTDARELEYGNQ